MTSKEDFQSQQPFSEDTWFALTELEKHIDKDRLSREQYQWLAESGSMTRQLKSASKMPLKVKVLTSGVQSLTESEIKFLDLAANSQTYVREVIMSVENEDWLFGRTVIPQKTLEGEGNKLMQLGSEPLGNLLFKQRADCREMIEVAKVTSAHVLYPQMHDLKKAASLWARRSMFRFNGQPLMVQEVFMPSCPVNRL